ncbi:MAG: F0F1 ATP synthase subunit A [Proteobacteria bacterium]|nr:F0F1 ATP synthase subunit A [Pseudomonadota bacterium]
MAEHAQHSPMAQFEVKPIFPLQLAGHDISYTNASLFMTLAVVAVVLFLAAGMRKRALVPGRFQSMAELSYEFVTNMIKDNIGASGRQYFPIIFTLFMFVITCNLLGMLPYSFTVTSQIVVTFAFAAMVFLGVTTIAFVRHGVDFLKFFVPAGAPGWIAPLMVFIELLAYLARPVTLSVRLAANMMAGHTMLKVIGGFVVALGFTLGWMPFLLLTLLTGFEIFVAVLQAYIFTVLVCVYLNDALHLHH